MTILQSQRVIYDNNPLAEVIAQLRFPPKLSIASELPVSFQNEIVSEYPYYERGEEVNVQIKADENGQPILVPNSPLTIHRFRSLDGKWVVTLTSEFLAVATTEYTTWDDFEKRLMFIESIFRSQYKSTIYTRLGLRYRNIINRETLDISNIGWDQLFQPFVLGFLAKPKNDNSIQEIAYTQRTTLQLDDQNSAVNIIVALDTDRDTGKERFLVDNDFYLNQQIGVENAQTIYRRLNSNSSRTFRECITSTLHKALKPRSI